MTSSHASHTLLRSLPETLAPTFFPPSCKPERFIEGGEHTVKGRNEPCAIGGVAWVIAKLHSPAGSEEQEATMNKVVEAAWENTVEVFGIQEWDVMQVPPSPQDQQDGVSKTEPTEEVNVEKEESPSGARTD